MKEQFKLPIFLASLLLVVFASACTGESTGENVVDNDITDNVNPSIDDTKDAVNTTNTTKLSIIGNTDEDEETDTRRKSSSDDDEPEEEADDEPETTQSSNGGDGNVQLSSYEGAANTTIKYSASGFDPSETVEVRMTGLQYTAATFYSHDGTIPPSDLYIPPHTSAGEPMEGKIEIVAKGTRSGKEFVAYYTVK